MSDQKPGKGKQESQPRQDSSKDQKTSKVDDTTVVHGSQSNSKKTGTGSDKNGSLTRPSKFASSAAKAKSATGAAAMATKNAVKERLKQADSAVTNYAQSGSSRPSSATAVASTETQPRTAPPTKPVESAPQQKPDAPRPQQTAQAPAASVRRTRKARLRLSRIDPWSVMKTTFLFAVAGAIAIFIATWITWGVIAASGVFDAVNVTVQNLVGSPDASEETFRLQDWVNTPRVLGFTALTQAINVILITALATLASFLYNLAATIMGGLELTLAED